MVVLSDEFHRSSLTKGPQTITEKDTQAEGSNFTPCLSNWLIITPALAVLSSWLEYKGSGTWSMRPEYWIEGEISCGRDGFSQNLSDGKGLRGGVHCGQCRKDQFHT